MSFHVVIPARYASTRLPGKVLLRIGNKPMIRWVVEAAERSRAGRVVVATDYQPVADAVYGMTRTTALMTHENHASGTDRVAEVARLRRWSDDEIVVNVQGDEPMTPPELIDQVASLLEGDPKAQIATLCTPIVSLEEFLNPNVVKVVMRAGKPLYFSRAPIPWNRDSARDLASQSEFPAAFRHIGMYAYRVAALHKLSQLPMSKLEAIEKLEQLRALEADMRMLIAVASVLPGPGVDTAADLERVRRMT